MEITLLSLFLLLLMALCLIGIVLGWKKYKDHPASKPAAGGLMVLLFILCLCFMGSQGYFGGGGSDKTQMKNNEKYVMSASFILGKHLAQKFKGQKVLIIARPHFSSDLMQSRMIQSLKEGFGGDIKDVSVVGFIPDSGPASGAGTLMSKPKASDFDAIIEKNPDCALVVSLVIPSNLEEMKIFEEGAAVRQKFAFLLCDSYKLKNAISAGIVPACVIEKLGATLPGKVPSDPQKAFDERYILVTAENVSDIASKNPVLFAQ
ncbi:MAG TPA: hypothetical protein DCZ94_02690 [Lentisphaeria bacterium]|nr:MAG: hypothetical protein A2X48_08155 [Lentisphaerae bacterium GWF2_49_21]HBC85841.1 hypothetical protein [Lentisphaeria bacterium]